MLLSVDLDARRRGGAVADRAAHRPGRRRRAPDGATPRRSSPTPSRPTSAGPRWASTPSPRSPARSSGWCSAACSRPSTGAWCSSSPCPFGIFGTVWAYSKLRGARRAPPARIDWWGNVTFALGLIAVLVASPTASSPTAATPWAGRARSCSAAMPRRRRAARVFVAIELRIDDPMFSLGAVPDPGVHRRQHRHAARLARPRRADVHADHLAAGHLAAAARLQLLRDAAVGRHLHAAADGRVPGRRPGCRAASRTASARGRSRPAACCSRRSASCCSSCCPSTSPTGRSPRCCC